VVSTASKRKAQERREKLHKNITRDLAILKKRNKRKSKRRGSR